jgi:hypothetical protein
MYLMYVDESGDTGLVNSPTTYFALSGIVVHERNWRPFMEALRTFRKTLRSTYGLPVRGEIHASEFINSAAYGLKRHVRLAILRNTLDELAKIPEISITNVIVNKADKTEGYDVFHQAWTALFQRFENTLGYGNFPGGHKKDFGLVFTDATAGMRLVRMMRRMAVYNPVPNIGGEGYRNLPIVRVIEDPHPQDSAESLPVQCADVCAYFLYQRYRPNAYIRKQRAHNYFTRLDAVLNKKASLTHALGIVEL